MDGRGSAGRFLSTVPVVLAGLAGAAIWSVFRPGFLCDDARVQLSQAIDNNYTDWYSPWLPFVLRHVGGLATATLIQAVIGAVAVYRLAAEVLWRQTRGDRPAWQVRWAALAVLAVLLTPFTPLMYFLAHFKNDTHAAIFLAWSVAGWLRVDRLRNRGPHQPAAVTVALATLAAVSATAAAVAVRYNAVALLPAFVLIAAVVFWPHRRAAAAVIAATVVAALGLAAAGPRVTAAARWRPERQIMASDLVGMVVEREDLRGELPYTNSFLLPEYRSRYVPGFVGPVMDWHPEGSRVVRVGYPGDFRRLSKEYKAAVRRHPDVWLAVKLKAAAATLLDPQPHWHFRRIVDNPYGVAFDAGPATVRTALLDVDAAVYADPVLRFLCARHLPWLVLNLAATGAAVIAALAIRTRPAWLTAAVLLLPLCYYASHLVAVAAHEYRYMLPATLTMQVMAVCWTGRFACRAAVRRALAV